MGLIEKLETLINKMLIFIGDRLLRLCLMVIPAFIINWIKALVAKLNRLQIWLKNLPAYLIKTAPLFIAKIKSILSTFDFKSKLTETQKLASEHYGNQYKKLGSFKRVVLTPFLYLGVWLKGLSSAQSLLLMSFTAASFLAGINIIFSGNRMMNHNSLESRAPASVEEDVSYDRPAYYKKQTRHLEISNLRLPVFFANVNELRSIDIDFSATLSNRMARMKLEKLEFQLRDHLILNVEPMVASFPLEEEGKDILKHKLHKEINDFLIERQIEGEVKDLKLIYILAN